MDSKSKSFIAEVREGETEREREKKRKINIIKREDPPPQKKINLIKLIFFKSGKNEILKGEKKKKN